MEVACVTGASRGIGRGIASQLSEQEFTVFATGRQIQTADLPKSVVRVPCDHLHDDQTKSAFKRLAAEAGQLDLLVNCAWGGYERMVEDGVFTWPRPFWEQPSHRWSSMMDVGVRSAYVCAAHAARMMVLRGKGLVVNISYWAAQKHIANVLYGVAKAATDKMTADMAHELRPFNVCVVSLYPGLVRTEGVLAAASAGWLDLSNSESPEFIGKVVAELARQPDLMHWTGQVLVAAAVAADFGLRDIDGKQPKPLTLQSA